MHKTTSGIRVKDWKGEKYIYFQQIHILDIWKGNNSPAENTIGIRQRYNKWNLGKILERRKNTFNCNSNMYLIHGKATTHLLRIP